MNASAIAMLIVAVLIIWGGLALSMLNLMKRSKHLPGRGELHRDL